jgi:dUTP pyrophosphatase
MQRDVTAKINLWHPDAKVPEYGTPLSAGFDLAVIEDVHLEPLEANVFHTGLIIQAPEDHMLLVVPRSSTFKKWKVSLGNTVGIVDEDFCGPDDKMRLYLYNPARVNCVDIPKGTRLAQGIFVPITRTNFEVVEGAISSTRGGWGSTGD